MITNRMDLDEYKRITIQGGRRSGSVRKDNSTSKILQQAIPAIRMLQDYCGDYIFTGGVGIEIKINASTRADKDNIFKGISDALQGYAFKDDKQVKRGYFE